MIPTRRRTPAFERAWPGRVAPVLCALALVGSPAIAQGQLWGVQMGTPTKDRARAVALDGASGVFVAGSTFRELGGASAGHQDIWLQRRDSAGALLWQRQFGSDKFDRVVAAAPDGAGGVYLCGSTLGDLAATSLGDFDVWLARIDAAGTTLWMRQFGTSTVDEVQGLASDGAGGVYLAGGSLGDYAGPNAGGRDAWVERVDSHGNRLWVRQFGSVFHESCTGAASDEVGGVFLVGSTPGNFDGTAGGGVDAFRARFDGAGNRLWIRQSQSQRPDVGSAVASDGSGGAFLVGTANWISTPVWNVNGWLARCDANGDILWNRPLKQSFVDVNQALADDGVGGVFLYASVVEPSALPVTFTTDIALSRYDGLGTQVWSRRMGSGLDPFDEWGDLVGDGVGGLYACGATLEDLFANSAGESDGWLVRLHGSQL